ncbi:hypothetical protein [Bdellovibrio sp. HCB337]|uniref:hypothetical protein n=1 Tax=Bdellovibrio sp. HCB337 TaxID=3394358 RepID=UPI0039A65894
MKQSVTTIIFSILTTTVATLGIIITSPSAAYAQTQPQSPTEFQTMYYDFAKQNIMGQERIDRFAQLSKSRLSSFLSETTTPPSKVSPKELNTLYKKFVESEEVGEAADTVLKLENRNTICYFRALWVHMHLLAMGVPDQSIRKMVIEGNVPHPNSIGPDWGYHIVTAVKANDQKWYTFDLETQQLLSVEDWLGYYQAPKSEKYSEYLFLLTVKPSHQFTLIDDHYDLSVIEAADIQSLMSFAHSNDKVYGKQLDLYLKK